MTVWLIMQILDVDFFLMCTMIEYVFIHRLTKDILTYQPLWWPFSFEINEMTPQMFKSIKQTSHMIEGKMPIFV